MNMDKKIPLFSIVTITFNAEQTLPATLASVVEQTFADYEYIVVDGQSTDRTVEIARSSGVPRMSIKSEKDSGLYDAMNKGIDRANGDYLIFLNAGDAFHSPSSLQELADAVKSGNCPDIVYGQTQIVDSERRFISMRHLTAPKRLTFGSFRRGMLVCHQAFVVRRALADHYDLRYRFSADYEWCLRMLKKMKSSAYTGTTLIDYLADGLTDRNHKASLRERYKIMCDYYGKPSTIVMHLWFAVRQAARRLKKAFGK